MHYPVFLLPIYGAVAAPLLWVLSSIILNTYHSFLPVIFCWLLCLAATYKMNQRPRNLFLGSGQSKPASEAHELLLQSKGKGDDFFSSHRTLGFADLGDFKFTQGKRISLAQLLKFRPFSIEPYCVDDERKQIIFVEMPMAFDAAMVGPFYFSTQRDFAQRLYAVPYEEFNDVCEKLTDVDMKRLILLYNTSRCGSTLVSKAFDSMAGVQSISEPDMFTSFTHIAAEARASGDMEKLKELSRLARNTARLMLFLRGNRHPDRPVLALKFRFQVINICDMLKEAIPEARSMFLYRNATDVIDSMGAAFINGGLYRLIRFTGLDIAYVFHFSALPTQLWKLMPLFGSKDFPLEKIKCLGAVSPFVIGWLNVMEKALEAQREGWIDTFFRYEDVVSHKAELLAAVLTHAGFECDPADADHVFKVDSQKNSVVKSNRRLASGKMSDRYAYLKSGDLAKIKRVIAAHREINHGDFIIPGTIQL